MPEPLKNKAIWIPLAAIVVIAVLLSFFRSPDDDTPSLAFNQAIAMTKQGQVDRIDVRSSSMTLFLRGGGERRVEIGSQTDIVAAFRAEGVAVGSESDAVPLHFAKVSSTGGWFWIVNIAPPLLFIAVVYFAVRLGTQHGMDAHTRDR